MQVLAGANLLGHGEGIRPHDLRVIEQLVFEHHPVLLSAYNGSRRNR
jgi:hypothetical protein